MSVFSDMSDVYVFFKPHTCRREVGRVKDT